MKETRVKTSLPRRTRESNNEPVFRGNKKHAQILNDSLGPSSSPRVWNEWRERHPQVVPDLRGLHLRGRRLRGINFSHAKLDDAVLERADLAGVHLQRASLRGANLRLADLSSVRAEKANMSGTKLRGAMLFQGEFRGATCLNHTDFQYANLRGADFSYARMIEADLTGAVLTSACFDGADLTNANLSGAILDQTSLLGTKLGGAGVSGSFIRQLKTDDKTEHHGLLVDIHVVWDKLQGDAIIFTEKDDIRIAQFHQTLEEPGAVGKLLGATTKRVVLILGRFLPRRKRVLDLLKEALKARGKIAVLFDFPSPEDREISDTVRFIAGMSQFIVVDLTEASSVPMELQATIPDLMVPVLPIVQSGQPVFSMFSDLQRRYSWIQPTVTYTDAKQLVKYVDAGILERAEQAAEKIKKRRAESISAPASIARVNRKRQSGRS